LIRIANFNSSGISISIPLELKLLYKSISYTLYAQSLAGFRLKAILVREERKRREKSEYFCFCIIVILAIGRILIPQALKIFHFAQDDSNYSETKILIILFAFFASFAFFADCIFFFIGLNAFYELI